jgi:hypothetical protein
MLMVTGNDEQKRQEIEALKKEVLAEIQRESLKKEIVRDIQTPGGKFSFQRLTQHPAFLLILGFVLTSLVGAGLTAYWQTKQWEKQQSRLVQLKGIEQKYEIIEEVTKAIGESNAAEQDVIFALSFNWRLDDPRRFEERDRRIDYWREQGGRTWRVNTAIIEQRLAIRFNNPAILDTFNRMMERRAQIAEDIAVLVKEYKDNNDIINQEGFIGDRQKILKDIEGNSRDLQVMVKNMLQEIQANAEEGDSSSFAALLNYPFIILGLVVITIIVPLTLAHLKKRKQKRPIQENLSG